MSITVYHKRAVRPFIDRVFDAIPSLYRVSSRASVTVPSIHYTPNCATINFVFWENEYREPIEFWLDDVDSDSELNDALKEAGYPAYFDGDKFIYKSYLSGKQFPVYGKSPWSRVWFTVPEFKKLMGMFSGPVRFREVLLMHRQKVDSNRYDREAIASLLRAAGVYTMIAKNRQGPRLLMLSLVPLEGYTLFSDSVISSRTAL